MRHHEVGDRGNIVEVEYRQIVTLGLGTIRSDGDDLRKLPVQRLARSCALFADLDLGEGFALEALDQHEIAGAGIAKQLYVSESTAKTHISKLYEKLGSANRAQALMTALKLGLLEAPDTPRF